MSTGFHFQVKLHGFCLHHSLGLSCMCSKALGCASFKLAWCCTSTMQIALWFVHAYLGDDIQVIPGCKGNDDTR